MKRSSTIALGVGLAAFLMLTLWFLGRAPSRYVLEQAGAEFQESRRRNEISLRYDISRMEAQLPRGAVPGLELLSLRAKRDALRREVRSLRIRGWEVLLIPAGAVRPEPRDFTVVDRIDPAAANDPPALRGGIEIWTAPRGALARLLDSLGID